MSLIISIETATKVCSVALHEDGKLLASQSLMLEKSHSTRLVVMIQQLLNNCQLLMSDIKAVAVSKGPGSYTGLRIGISTAKGLCYALGIPLIGINTLKAMAYQLANIPGKATYYCPMIDARRMEVYCMMLNNRFQVETDTWAQIVNSNSFEEWTDKHKVLFFGNGSEKCRKVLSSTNCLFMDDLRPSASTVGLLAYKKFEMNLIEDLAYFEPFYLKKYRTTVPKIKAGLTK